MSGWLLNPQGNKSLMTSAVASGQSSFALFQREYATAWFVSISFHVVLLVLMLGWRASHQTVVVNTPSYVKARLMKSTPTSRVEPAPTISVPPELFAPPPPIPQPAVVEKPKVIQPKIDKKQLEKQRREQQRLDELARQKQAAQEQLAREQAEADQRRKEQKRKADEDLANALAAEERAERSAADDKAAQSYANAIKQRVEANWSRPPSARKGMEVVLLIQLAPSGYVVGVTVEQGSGNAAFDLSAQQAVRKVERFTEIKDMPSALFESKFRNFRLKFRPDDKID